MFKSNDWRNVCYADYFGLDKIKREKRRSSTDGNKFLLPMYGYWPA